MSDENKNPTLNGQAITPEKLEEAKQNLPKNQRIVEKDNAPGEHTVLTRLRD